MVGTKKRGKYQAISLPFEYVDEVRKHILKDKQYRSIAEFVKLAVEEKINRETIKGGFSKGSGRRSFVDPYADLVVEKMADDIFNKVLKKLEEKGNKKNGEGNGHGLE